MPAYLKIKSALMGLESELPKKPWSSLAQRPDCPAQNRQADINAGAHDHGFILLMIKMGTRASFHSLRGSANFFEVPLAETLS